MSQLTGLCQGIAHYWTLRTFTASWSENKTYHQKVFYLSNGNSIPIQTIRTNDHRLSLPKWNFLTIPSYFKIEILAIRDEFVTPGHKGLNKMHRSGNMYIWLYAQKCLRIVEMNVWCL